MRYRVSEADSLRPMSHVTGSLVLTCGLLQGFTTYMMIRFEFETFLALIQQYQVCSNISVCERMSSSVRWRNFIIPICSLEIAACGQNIHAGLFWTVTAYYGIRIAYMYIIPGSLTLDPWCVRLLKSSFQWRIYLGQPDMPLWPKKICHCHYMKNMTTCVPSP